MSNLIISNKIINVLVLYLISLNFSYGQTEGSKKPKLVIGIVVDQMRAEQLYRYETKYSEDGFKRILRDGFNYKNTQYNYTPTVTAAGHSSIYTGTTPAIHGVIGNSWYNRYNEKHTSSVKDTTVVLIGSKNQNNIGASPKQLLTTTISDQLRMSTNFRSKVISVSLKDRGAVLPGGHLANAAYWYDIETSPGYFVSSSYYMNELPKWVSKFNKLEKSSKYLDTVWNTLYPIESYTESYGDNNKYEVVLGDNNPTFPYDFNKLREKYRKRNIEYLMLGFSPAGNTLLTEFAMDAVKNEKLGSDEETDMLTISYSVTDKAGHIFGPNSVEIEDIYLRLDLEISKLLKFLDKEIGKGEYTLFLTSDHGAVPIASYLNDIKVPTGVARIARYKNQLSKYLSTKYGEGSWIQNFEDDQLYLNRTAILEKGLQLESMQQDAVNFLVNLKGISGALASHHLQTSQYNSGLKKLVQNGYHQKRSGDVLLTFDAGLVQDDDSEIEVSSVKGTIHGSGYSYDTHVPLLWFGNGITHGESVRKVSPIDISSTLTMILNLQLPSGNSGYPLKELFK
ncbi:alkaline phosphatase PafA [Polaribacter dokdonensis]|uniref:PI-irrepressible alkaline phosphatase PafA n=1 Tax=Polaribacter dokdonensis DSW-5 TaxID=1300348 RepID=A0A0N0CGC3_9FLAO|nr:alkaline phosphatase PafA [Polaribacter dokdonensis]KOY53138.1 PI-irrepressible alkaline phosphatase PafA [Polaribacter dokdonensis DSW-5]SEE57618.1 Type I phosphodiesterase / nucleotide pyrophosphatase [Polaribacter dokdonensis DSW-5]